MFRLLCYVAAIILWCTTDVFGANWMSGSRLMHRLFGVPPSCAFNGAQYGCTLSFVCWLNGGQAQGGCGNRWVFTCCVPPAAAVRADSPFPEANEITLTDVECGVQRLLLQKRIIGGHEAHFGEFPWQAHIRIAGYQCGGVLLNHFYVATAAHCVHRARLSEITIYLGEYDTKDTGYYIEPIPEEVFAAVEKKIHPNFKYRLTQPDRFDIALLRLNRPALYKENILPICLPPETTNYQGRIGVVAGWGKTDASLGKTGTNILQKVLVPIISNGECLIWHEQKHIQLELHDEMFCAGHRDGKMDACLGDSGGPLIVHDRGRWTLVGITSAGFGCAIDRQPGIYHKVTTTTHWLRNNML